MDNIEIKKDIWAKVKPVIEAEVGNKYTVNVSGLDDDSDYFHPYIMVSENEYLRAQCDIENDHYYAVSLRNKIVDTYPQVDVSLSKRSFKESLILLKTHKVISSVAQTLNEVAAIEKNIEYLRELKAAKIKLLNSMIIKP